MSPEADLEGILADLEQAAESRDRLTADEMLDVVGARGFGPVLAVLSLFLLLPVGMVPGMPAVVGLVLILIGVLMMMGRKRLHLPRRIGRLALAAHRITAVTRRMRPWAARLRALVHPRLTFLAASRPAVVALGLVLAATGLVLIFIGFVPFLPFVLALHVVLIGIGLTMRDGIVVLLGLALLLPEVWLLWRFAPLPW